MSLHVVFIDINTNEFVCSKKAAVLAQHKGGRDVDHPRQMLRQAAVLAFIGVSGTEARDRGQRHHKLLFGLLFFFFLVSSFFLLLFFFFFFFFAFYFVYFFITIRPNYPFS